MMGKVGIKTFSQTVLDLDRWQGGDIEMQTESFYHRLTESFQKLNLLSQDEWIESRDEELMKKVFRKRTWNLESSTYEYTVGKTPINLEMPTAPYDEASLLYINKSANPYLDNSAENKQTNAQGLQMSNGKGKKSTINRGLRSQFEEDNEELFFSECSLNYHNSESSETETDENGGERKSKKKHNFIKSSSFPLKIFNCEDDETFPIQTPSSYKN